MTVTESPPAPPTPPTPPTPVAAPRSRLVRAVRLAMVVAFGLRLALLAQPMAGLDRRFVPDDTYYTLTIARSMAHLHGPTADGTTLTSGFQPLLGFLMVPVYWFTNNLDLALRIDLFMLIVVDTLIVAVVAWIAFRLAGRVAAVAAAMIWALSPVATTMALGGLETSLALFCEIGLVAACIWANDRPRTGRWVVVGVISGLAVLARVDALLLVALLALAQLVRGPRKALVPASIAGVLTLAPWWGWCAINLGTPIPTSGTALHKLATYAPFSQHNLALVSGAVSGGPFANPTALRTWLDDTPVRGSILFVAIVAGLLAIAYVWFRRSLLTRDARGNAHAAVAALPVFAVGLMFFYAWFGVWYFNTRYLAPVQLGVTLALAVLVGHLARELSRVRERARVARVGVIALAGALGLGAGAAVVYDVAMVREDAPRSHLLLDAATGFRAAAQRAVTITPEHSVVAAYQSGALSYYGEGIITTVNLDGVVNPDAPSPAVPADTLRYMQQRKVQWISDWDLFERRLVKFDPRSDFSVFTSGVAHYPQLPRVEYRILYVIRYWPHPVLEDPD